VTSVSLKKQKELEESLNLLTEASE